MDHSSSLDKIVSTIFLKMKISPLPQELLLISSPTSILNREETWIIEEVTLLILTLQLEIIRKQTLRLLLCIQITMEMIWKSNGINQMMLCLKEKEVDYLNGEKLSKGTKIGLSNGLKLIVGHDLYHYLNKKFKTYSKV